MDQLKWFLSHTYNWICGLLVAYVGYFSPIIGVINVMMAAIVIDLIVGVIAARCRGDGIKSKKLWRTGYKFFFALMIVHMMYAMDKEMGMVEMHRVIAWLITGFEMWSILESCASISDHRVFRIIKKLMADKIKDKTGIDINTKQDE